MLLRNTDPFREFDSLARQMLGTTNRPAVMPMDAWREGDRFVIEFDLPGVSPDSIDLDVERNVLTVRAERPAWQGETELLASERPRGVFSRQLMLSDTLDTEHVTATYQGGVLRLEIPVAPESKPRKISVSAAESPTVVSGQTDDQPTVTAAQHAENSAREEQHKVDA